jgi:hypothetical protein
VPQDDVQAASWFREAANHGDALAQKDLGALYNNGQGVSPDYSQAVYWYRKAATQGDADAQFQLGDSYDHGHGVPQDYVEAYFWYDLAASRILGLLELANVDTQSRSPKPGARPAFHSRAVEKEQSEWLTMVIFDTHRVRNPY